MTAQREPLHRWVVVATYNAAGEAADHLVEQLKDYRELGFDVLVADASPTIGAERRAHWDRFATRWLHRENVGYDFGSWVAGCELLVSQMNVAADRLELILANDSCFGPYVPIRTVLDGFRAVAEADPTAYGMTESRETGQLHLQSYWLYFPPRTSPLALDFLRTMSVPTDRTSAINLGELKLSHHLRSRGCRLVAHVTLQALMERCCTRRFGGKAVALLEFGMRRLLKRYRYTRLGDGACIKFLLGRPDAMDHINPTLDFGRYLHSSGSSPFIKIMLLRDNPNGDRHLPERTDVCGMTNRRASEIVTGRTHTPACAGSPATVS